MDSHRLLSILSINNPILYGVLTLLVLLSAYFSSAETAFSSCNIIRLKNYVEEGKKGAKKALYSAERFEKTLTTILIGNNIVNIGLATISATVALELFDNPTVANIINTVVVTTILLIFGEILPKSIAKENAESLALKYGASMYVLTIFMSPVAAMLSPIKKTINKVYNVEVRPSFTDDELETLIDTMEEEGTIKEDSADMMQGVLDLKDKDVDDIMTPRVDVIMISIDADVDELKEVFVNYQLSRIPVYLKDKDNVVGKVHFKDFMLAYFNDVDVKIKDIMSDVHYVPETMSVDHLIEELQKNQEHMAIVTGEYGGTTGIVTMEDALEVLVGEIFDEHDEEFAEFLPLGNNKYMVHGDFNLDDLFDELDLPEPVSGYSSVGGFIYENLEKYPEIDDFITYECVVQSEGIREDTVTKILVFTVKDVSDRRILSVEIKIIDKEEL